MTNMIASSIDRIDYEESGTGPTVIFVPGSCSTGAAWRPVIAALGGQFRCVTTSLPGYGGTAERRSPIDPPVLREVEVVEHVVRRAVDSRDVPVHLVGHSFGGLVGLAMALSGTARLASLTILEAPLPGVLQACDEPEAYRAFRDLPDRYVAAYRAGQPAAIDGMSIGRSTGHSHESSRQGIAGRDQRQCPLVALESRARVLIAYPEECRRAGDKQQGNHQCQLPA